jgi:hypothetical protein
MASFRDTLRGGTGAMDTPAAAIQQTAPPSEAEDAARGWAAAGHEVTLQGTVVHHRASRTVALYCATVSLLSLTALLRPALAMVGLSAVMDLDGGRGWLRSLLPRQADHNVVAWPEGESGPLLLVVAPLESEVPTHQVPMWLLRIPLGLLGLSALGCVLSTWHPEVAKATLLTTGLCLGLVGLAAIGWDLLTRTKRVGNPARAAVELAIPQIERAGLEHLRCAWALVGGELSHHDGLETLLLNHQHRLRKDCTRVLLLHPDWDILGAVHHEGRIRRQASDKLLVGAMRGLGLAGRHRTTGASRVKRAGWRAAAMTVSPEQTHAAAGVISKMAEQLDQLLGGHEDTE